MRKRASSLGLLATGLLTAACLASCSAAGQARLSDAGIPVSVVEQGHVQLRVNTSGELRSTRTAMMTAPAIAGGTLQIIHLLRAGSLVKAGDAVVDFDPSQQEYNLGQNRSDYQQAEQEIVKAKDDLAVQSAQDQTALLKAHFDVRQAELEVSKNELVSSIDAQKNQLALDEARRALEQLQQDIQSHAASGQATMAVDQEKAHKAKLAMDQALENIRNMQVRSPINGLVVIRQNMNASGGFFFGGMSLPDYQQGDQANPGAVIADVIDMDNMEITAHVSESDRTNVKVGQAVEIRVDALPGVVLRGTVKNVAAVAGDFFDGGNGSSEVSIALDGPNKQLRPGFTAHVVILGDEIGKALWVPREAVFEKDGKTIVYARGSSGFAPRLVQIRYLSEGLAIIGGLQAGTEVAVIDPSEKARGAAKPAAAAGPMGAPR